MNNLPKLPFSLGLEITAYELTPNVWRLGVYNQAASDNSEWDVYQTIIGLENLYESELEAEYAALAMTYKFQEKEHKRLEETIENAPILQ